jgi:hypothetical protein
MRVSIPLDEITDFESFHAVFARQLKFFDGYGANLDAWIDCMSDWTTAGEEGLMELEIPEGDDLILVLAQAEDFCTRLAPVAAALWDCTAEVNARFADTEFEGRVLLELA